MTQRDKAQLIERVVSRFREAHGAEPTDVLANDLRALPQDLDDLLWDYLETGAIDDSVEALGYTMHKLMASVTTMGPDGSVTIPGLNAWSAVTTLNQLRNSPVEALRELERGLVRHLNARISGAISLPRRWRG